MSQTPNLPELTDDEIVAGFHQAASELMGSYYETACLLGAQPGDIEMSRDWVAEMFTSLARNLDADSIYERLARWKLKTPDWQNVCDDLRVPMYWTP